MGLIGVNTTAPSSAAVTCSYIPSKGSASK